MARSRAATQADLAKEMATLKMEDEVKMEEMESGLRRLVVELVKPTVLRTTQLQVANEELHELLKNQTEVVAKVEHDMQLTKERSEKIEEFRRELDEFDDRMRETDANIYRIDKETNARLMSLETRYDSQTLWNEATIRSLDRAREDIEVTNTETKRLARSLEAGLQQQKESWMDALKTLTLKLEDVSKDVALRCDEIWGPMENLEIGAPSLRRSEHQLRRLTHSIQNALDDLAALRRLDDDVRAVSGRQASLNDLFRESTAFVEVLREQIGKIEAESKEDHADASAKFSAYSFRLQEEVRVSFENETQYMSRLGTTLEEHMSEGQHAIQSLEESVRSVSKHVEASMREMHTDIDGVDAKRRKDKQYYAEGLNGAQSRIDAAVDTQASAVKGLEHVSNVIGMSLQSQRIAVALDVQDFVDRKDTPYVGLRPSSEIKVSKTDVPWRKEGLDPTTLCRLAYRPNQIVFNGTYFDRPQLLALREKLVHVAQEVLKEGPSKTGAKRALEGPSQEAEAQATPPLVTQLLGAVADAPLTKGDHRSHRGQISRPGSRGQPSARGTPTPEGVHRSYSKRDSGDREEFAQRPREFCTGTPDSTSAPIPGTEGFGNHHLPVLAGDTERERAQRGSSQRGAGVPRVLTAR